MIQFTSPQQLIEFGRKFLEERLTSLQKDVEHCLREPYAPFPALLYCFATVDLLGALMAGNASRKAPTASQASKYMKRFMSYTDEQARLLQNQFRHKLVHLAQPKAVIRDNGRDIAWKYWHESENKHLQVLAVPVGKKVQVPTSYEIPVSHQFNVSITDLVEDIVRSVKGPKGYLASLSSDPCLQNEFQQAVNQIYDPAQ